jgi:acyl-CoA reductase-like NAD-dependent aldehyde dehydrogenase
VALDVADRPDAGMVWINQREGGGPELPFGETKRSSVGRVSADTVLRVRRAPTLMVLSAERARFVS